MDPVDVAKVREMEHRETSLENQLQRAREDDWETPIIKDGVPHCRDCLEPISKERLDARPNCSRCFDCKLIMELKKRRANDC